MAGVVLKALRKVFHGPRKEEICAVQDLNLDVAPGELMALVGPSGCGKTTTLRLIAGLEKPSDGSILLEGRELNGVEPKDREVAMVFQNHALYPHMTVRENMASGLVWRKFPRTEVETRVHEIARLLELTDCLDRLPEAISGGQRQRVAVGRALVLKPKVFLFDEPLSDLDTPMRLQLRREIMRLNHSLQATMLYVTHDQSEAMAMGDRIAVMREGRLQQVATPREIYQRPVNRFVASFFGSPAMNFFNGTIEVEGAQVSFRAAGTDLKLKLGSDVPTALKTYAGQPVTLGLRPEHIQPAVTDTCPQMEAVIELVEVQGAETWVQLKAGAAVFTGRFPPADHWRAGQKITVGFSLSGACFFDPTTEKAIT